MRIFLGMALSVIVVACAPGGIPGVPPAPGQPAVIARDLVRSDTFTKLIIEIDAVEGRGPNAAALELFREEVEALIESGHLGKPDGFEIRVDDTLAANGEADHEYTTAEQDDLSRSVRDDVAEPGEAFVHMLYLDGHSEISPAVLGYAYGGSFIVMFRDRIDGACDDGLGLLTANVRDAACEVVEASVLFHELGHLLGLVNNGTAMVVDHRDDENGAHDTNEDCLMHFLADRANGAQVIAERFLRGENGVTQLDQNCRDDLLAAQQ